MLVNLGQIFNNEGGNRTISIKDLVNKGEDSTFNVAEQDVDNKNGIYDVDIGNILNSGVRANTNIGLMNLASSPVMPHASITPILANQHPNSLIVQIVKPQG